MYVLEAGTTAVLERLGFKSQGFFLEVALAQYHQNNECVAAVRFAVHIKREERFHALHNNIVLWATLPE
jgi:hypothetical protein